MKKYKELYVERYKKNPEYFIILPSLSLGVGRTYFKEDFGEYLINLNPYIEYNAKSGYRWISKKHEQLYYWTRKAYFGGRCEIYNMNYLKNVYYYDFNSLYPSMCIMNKFPNPSKYYILNNPEIEKFETYIHKQHLYIIEATVSENIHYPILRVRDKERIVKNVNGVKRGVWTSVEFNRFLEFSENYILKIHKIKVYRESEYYFKNYMLDRFTARKDFIKNEQYALAEIEKLLMNSYTGKFAQKPINEGWTLYTEELELNVLYENEPINIIEFEKGYKLIKVRSEFLRDFMICDFTAFITAYSYIYLHNMFYLLIENDIEFFYTDTDCIFVNKPLEKNKNLKGFIGDNYGQLKNELMKGYDFLYDEEIYINRKTLEKVEPFKFNQAKFYLPKVYVLERGNRFQVKAKGISLFMIYETLGIKLERSKDTEEQMHNYLNSFERIEELLFKTGVTMDRFLKYKSSLRRNQTIISHAEISKRVSKVYDKRYINNDLSTKPLNNEDLNDLKKIQSQNLNNLLSNRILYYVTKKQT